VVGVLTEVHIRAAAQLKVAFQDAAFVYRGAVFLFRNISPYGSPSFHHRKLLYFGQ